MSDLLIHNCHALLLNEQHKPTIQRNQDILIDGALITRIQPTAPLATYQVQTVISAHEMLAMPGLINCHAHVPMVLFRGIAEDVSVNRWFNDFIWPVESNLTREDVYWGMLLGLVEMIEAGVTTVADHYFFVTSSASLPKRLRATVITD